jgi:hypothetical protein
MAIAESNYNEILMYPCSEAICKAENMPPISAISVEQLPKRIDVFELYQQ